MPDDNVNIEAQWKANTYTITVDGSTKISVVYGQYYSLTVPTKSGYTFRHFIITDTSETFSAAGYYRKAENIAVVSRWLAVLDRTTSSSSITISESCENIAKGLTFTIVWKNSSGARNIHIESNLLVNAIFYAYSDMSQGVIQTDKKSCGMNYGTAGGGGITEVTVKITIKEVPTYGTFRLVFSANQNHITTGS